MVPGDIVDQRFAIEQLAGSGGMGAVYRARDARTHDLVALKVLLGTLAEGASVRFEREARALAELEHPGVVRHVAHGFTNDGRPYLAMEWIEGEDLAARLKRGPLSLQETITLGIRVADAIGAAHRRSIVHRDIKPGNVILADYSVERAKVVDFGLATFPDTVRATQSGMVVGTPSYMAPEQAQGTQAIDPRADVFALGCMLYECITGEPAFSGAHVMAVLAKIVFDPIPLLRDIGHDVPAAFDAVLARMMAKSPSARFAHGSAAADALRDLADAGPAGASVPQTGNRPTLTAAEQRFMSTVLACSPSITTNAQQDETLAAPDGGPLRTVLSAIEASGGHCAVLSDGTLAVSVRAGGVATDHAALAARCALVISKVLPDSVIAVATGRAEAAGARPMGDAIERAARMLRARQRAAGPPAIDLDDVTAGLLDLRFEIIGGPFGLELAGEHEVAETPRTLLGHPTVFVGRQREVAAIEALFAESIDEPAARAALVTAPAGVGKSRLRHEITGRIAAHGGAEVWIARGDPMRAGTSFGLISQLVRRISRLVLGEPIEASRQKLLARVSRNVGANERLRVAEFLGELVGTPFPDEGRVPLRAARHDPRLLGDQIRSTFLALLDAETRARPLVIVLEDLHWGDPPSVEVLDAALRLLKDRPLLVLAFARPEIHERLPRLWHDRGAQEIRLLELSRRDCERLTYDVLGERATSEIATRLWEHSSGNAFFLEELLRATADGSGGELPETMLAMIESRLAQLDPEDRRLLRAASVLGVAFWRGGLAALLGADAHREQRLARLEHGEWITRRPVSRIRDEEEYSFRHVLVREAAYAMLTDEDRLLGHRLAAAWLESTGETDAAVLAEHFERGCETESAVRWYCAAAEHSLEGNDLAEVIARVDRASALGASGEVLGRLALARALAHNWRQEHGEAASWAEKAISTLPPGSARWCSAVGELIWTAGNSGDSDRVLALAELLLASNVDVTSRAVQAMALAHAVGWLMQCGRREDGKRIQQTIQAMVASVRDDPTLEAAVRESQVYSAYSEGDIAALWELNRKSVAYFEGVGDERQACRHIVGVTDACDRLGAYAEAEAFARECHGRAARLGLTYLVAHSLLQMGIALLRQGSCGEARRVLTQASLSAHDAKNAYAEGSARTHLALAHQRSGALNEAEIESRKAISLLGPFRPLLALAMSALADVLLARGRSMEALQNATEAFEIVESVGDVEGGDARVRLLHAEALAANDQHEAARTALAAARDLLLERASHISDERWRRSFLHNVPENARTLDLARSWLDD